MAATGIAIRPLTSVALGWYEPWGDIGTCIGMVAQGAKGRPTGATKLYESVGMKVESSIVVFEKAVA
jgi:hypothetical protein